MAEVSVILSGLSGKSTEISEIVSFELVNDIDAACDGLSLSYRCKSMPFEIITVAITIGGQKVFFGYCDKERYSRNSEGYDVYIYARSSAALLVDNEAQPTTYVSPCVNTLFRAEAEKYGFKNRLRNLSTEHEYTVSKGVSGFGAINDFVKTICGESLRVNAENELYIPDGKGKILLDCEDIISERTCINRALPYTQIDYKLSGDGAYLRHYKSRLAEERKILRTRKVNISALPQWQREYELKDRLRSYFDGYREFEVTLVGVRHFNLCDRAVYKELGDKYRLCKSTVLMNEHGTETHLTFREMMDLKEVNYVAE